MVSNSETRVLGNFFDILYFKIALQLAEIFKWCFGGWSNGDGVLEKVLCPITVGNNMKKIVIGAVIAVLVAIWYTQSHKPVIGIVVTTKNGPVQGIISKSGDGREFYEWRGIPYAEQPVGDLRFASPKPATNWRGVKDGSEFGPICAQVQALGEYVRFIGSEDCLYLNVHVPKLEENKLLPVMVWIHGGAFVMGSSNENQADYLMDQDVVVVTINYRLGPFGFLSTADGAIRGNMGLKDQALALKWVRDNIEAFGGDPKKVTIFGVSADNLPPVLDAVCAVLKLAWMRFLGFKGRDYGVCHGDELPMLFSLQGMIHVAKNDHDPDYLFSKALVKLWTDFAKDEKNLELAGLKFDSAPKSGPFKYFHMSENPSLTTPEFLKRTEYLKSLGF